MKRFFRSVAHLAVAAILMALLSVRTGAAQPSGHVLADEGWKYDIGPHIWFAGVQGKVRLGDRETEFDFGHDYFRNTWNPFDVGVTVHFKAWRARKSFTLNVSYLEELNRYVAFPESILKIQFKQLSADFTLGYQVRDKQPRVDVIGGLRTIILQPDIVYSNSISTSRGRAWVNFFLGLVARTRPIANLEPIVRVDVGGLKADSKTWSLWAGLEYRISSVFTLRGGYRRIDFDHTDDGGADIFVYDATTDGLVLGLSATF